MSKFHFRKFKRILKKVYHRFFPIEKPKPFIHTYDVRELFFQENLPTGFKRYDMIVRLLAIENYYGKNNFGWDYYKRMQAAHLGKDKAQPAIEQFERLIKSYEEKGYDVESHIRLDNRLMLWDGSHRMALAFYHHNYKINCEVMPESHEVDVSLTSFSFMKIGFSKEEENIINERYVQLFKEIIEPCVVTLWKPISNYYDRITDNLRNFGEIISLRDIELSDFNYGSLMLKIYSCDDGTKEGIKQKILLQKKYCQNKLRFVYLNIDHPNYRIKQSTQNPISQTCERLKRNIRKTYKKYIEDYHDIHDGIIHIGDNYYQNLFIRELIEHYDKVPVDDIFHTISKYNYVLTKFDTPYMTKDYPRTYPLGKDADILCLEEDQDNISNTILEILKGQEYKWEIKYIRDANSHIYIYIYNQFIYGFDICSTYLSKEFVEDAIKNRIKKNQFYVTDESHEFIVRLYEFKKDATKRHHADWILNHYPQVSNGGNSKFLTNDLEIVLNTIKR